VTQWNLTSLGTAGGVLLLVALVAVGVAAAITATYGVIRSADRLRTKRTYLQIVLEAFPYIAIIALIGGLSGQVAGSSRVGVVGQVLPALFTAFGGFTAYYVGIKRDRGGKVAVNSVAFLLTFFVMYNVSAIWRQDPEAWEFCRDLYSNAAFDKEDREDRDKHWGRYCGDVAQRWTSSPVVAAGAPPQ
jgi:hypothetical protein